MSSPASSTRPWLETPAHLAWLDDNIRRLLRFGVGSQLPGGGFAWLDADRRPLPERTPQLFLTARMAHVASIGFARGIPGTAPLLDHAIDSLEGLFADHEDGGFFADPAQPDGRKATYDHVQVGLGAASATAVGHPGGRRVLDTVLDLVETQLWDGEANALRESFARNFADSEDYRGANANMHGLEAFLAFGDVTGERIWHERGLAIAMRCVESGPAHDWLLPEHYDAQWRELPEYNRDDPNHPFRPYGATYGHSLEWARLLLQLHASPAITGEDWLVEFAVALASRALDDGWAADGSDGLVYTVDWDGTPVSRLRMHWPICEAIWTSAALLRATGNRRWEAWYRRAWDFAATHLIDENGAWINELDPDLRPSETVWPGRPDFYHALGALAGPTAPLTPFITLASTGERSRIAPMA